MVNYFGTHSDVIAVDKCLRNVGGVVCDAVDDEIKVHIAVQWMMNPTYNEGHIRSVISYIDVYEVLLIKPQNPEDIASHAGRKRC